MSETPPKPQTHHYEDISVGVKHQREYVISPEVYGGFLAAFDDRSPIHVDENYAQACGFTGKVMHGTLLNGFLSHFVGMHFPGRLSLLLSSDLRFSQPSYLGDVIQLEAVVSQKLDAHHVVILTVTFNNLTQNCLAARGRIQVMVRDDS